MVVEQIDGRYDVERRLGGGGMGDVWEANDTLLGRRVAIKFVGEKELRENPSAGAILRDEARHAGQLLGHPQIVAVLDLIQVDTVLHKGPAIVLEYVEGCHVGEWITQYRGTLDPFTRDQTALFIGMQIVEALHFAHKRDILHRDVKPQNVLLSVDGGVKVSDFGLSRVVEEITRTHTVWGRHTPLYAAPEQWRDEKPDNGTDIYQLSATLYHLLAGVPANQGKNLIGLLRWHETGTVEPLQNLVPDLDMDVAKIVEKGLSKESGKRPSLWQLFDAFSNALARTAQLAVEVPVGPDGTRDKHLCERIAKYTDFDEEVLKQGTFGTTFVHPLEAIQEAIGVTLLGGRASLSPGRSKEQAPTESAATDGTQGAG